MTLLREEQPRIFGRRGAARFCVAGLFAAPLDLRYQRLNAQNRGQNFFCPLKSAFGKGYSTILEIGRYISRLIKGRIKK